MRLAIGALGGDILRLVFGQGLRWVALGLLLSLGGTFALASTLAILVPAWRAAKLDPLVALRTD